MPSLTIRVPKSLIWSGILPTKAGVAKETKDFIVSSVKLREGDLKPAIKITPYQAPSINESIWLSDNDIKNIRGFFANDLSVELSDGECVSAFLLDSFRFVEKMENNEKSPIKSPIKSKLTKQVCAEKDSPIYRMLKATGRDVRHEQSLILKALSNDPAPPPHSVLFCEAGTGIGKTIAYLGAAFDVFEKNPSANIVIALPTNALINQIKPDIKEFSAIAKNNVSVRYIRPQRDWVSASALHNFIEVRPDENLELAQKMLDWLPLDAAEPDEWLMSRFSEAFPDFIFGESIGVDQRVSDVDYGFDAYRTQFKRESVANLTIMTHAMLATLTRINLRHRMKLLHGYQDIQLIKSEWKKEKEAKVSADERIDRLYTRIHAHLADFESPEEATYYLPTLNHLIIDEAHKFEDAMASAFSQTISVRQLIEQIDKVSLEYPGSLSQEAIKNLREFGNELTLMADNKDEPMETDAALIEVLAAKISAAIKMKPKTSVKIKDKISKTPVYRRATLIVKSIETDLAFHQFGGKISVFVGSSPVKGYPQVTVGQPYLGKPFDYLYRVMTNRTTLMSGTLYTGFPPSVESSRIALGVQPDLKKEMAPIESKWQIAPVTLQMVAKTADGTGRQRFIRPSKTKLDEDEYNRLYRLWIIDVGRYVFDAWLSAAGGVLVLASSFRDVENVEMYLAGQGIGSNLIVHERGMNVHSLRLRFINESARASIKPLMIATGAAWTGLDIHDESQKNLLTDLVILNAPFGVKDKNAASLRRLAGSNKFFELAHHATVLVRQSVGRLVRSPDTLPNRRLHWLDARVHSGRNGLFRGIKAFLGKYRKIDVA